MFFCILHCKVRYINSFIHSFMFVYWQPLTDEIVRQGEKVTLECHLSADWLPDSVQWFCNGVELVSSPDYVISPFVGGVCRLTICDVFPEDSATYSCVAMYSGEPVTTTMNLRVMGLLSHVLSVLNCVHIVSRPYSTCSCFYKYTFRIMHSHTLCCS